MLTAPIFAQSTRCKKFLKFIVSETLAGNALQLKERTMVSTSFTVRTTTTLAMTPPLNHSA
jgi:hypothetical protein